MATTARSSKLSKKVSASGSKMVSFSAYVCWLWHKQQQLFGVSWTCRAVDIGSRYCSFVVDCNIVYAFFQKNMYYSHELNYAIFESIFKNHEAFIQCLSLGLGLGLENKIFNLATAQIM
jgi:hypothetical protein